MTNKDNIDRTLGVDCTIVVDGKKYSTTVYPTHENLPDGYRVDATQLYFGKELLAEYDPFFPDIGLRFFGGFCGDEKGEASINIKHAAAIAAFLQGAR